MKNLFCLGVFGLVALGASAAPMVDFTVPARPIRRALYASGWGGQLTGPQSAKYREIGALGFSAARTHDWALNNPGQRMCDLHFMFPLIHADTEDSKNYFFGPTDEILAMTIEDLGMDVMFRMGTSIESVNARRKDKQNPPRYYNSVEPLDWEQFTKAHAQIIRHYTEGKWNGFKWGEKMKYWELWNEPNDRPGGSWIIRTGDTDRGVNNYTFNSFFIYVLKRLKAEFPHLKFGGPATCNYDVKFLTELLTRCKEADYTPDFISWHSYGDDPTRMLGQPAKARKLLDDMGFTKTELVINEWHWYPDSWWGNATAAQRLDPNTGVTSIRAATYALQVMTGIQETCLDQSYFYGCSDIPGNVWGYRLANLEPNKHFWAIHLLADVFADCDTFQPTGDVTSPAPVRVFGAKSRDGRRAYLLVMDYCAEPETITVTAKGLEDYAVKGVRATDKTRNYAALAASFVTRKGDTFEMRKPAASSAAAYLIVLDNTVR